MKLNITKGIFAGAALAGLIAGGTFRASAAQSTGKVSADNAGVLAKKKAGETHECKGHNSCKGKGGCKTDANACAGKNECKGKGGCGMKDGKPNPPAPKEAK